MEAPPPPYSLLPLRRSVAQTSVDALVSVLWRRLHPGQTFGQNHRLDRIFDGMSHWPELATLQLCPYYFDQVTCRLPAGRPVEHSENCNLRLRCFHSWADPETERQRTAGQRRPGTGVHLSGLCLLRDPHTSTSISNRRYVYLMYG